MNFELVAIEKDLPPINLSKIEPIDLLRVQMDGQTLLRMSAAFARAAAADAPSATLYIQLRDILGAQSSLMLAIARSDEPAILASLAMLAQCAADLAVALDLPFSEGCEFVEKGKIDKLKSLIEATRF